MPTSHPRVQVTIDSQLASALRRAAPNLSSASRAGQIRELALRGAERLDAFDAAAYDQAVEQLSNEDLPGLEAVVAQRHGDPA